MDALREEIIRLTGGVAAIGEVLKTRRTTMTPKFRGVSEALAKLRHSLDHDADKLVKRIEDADARRDAVFAKSHKTLDTAHQGLDDINKFIDDLERSNQGPPLDDSASGSSGPRSTEVAEKIR